MWTVLQKRKPSTLWMTMPPRVEETKTHVLFFFSCNVINHVCSKLCREKIFFQPSAIMPLSKKKWLCKRSYYNHCCLVDILDVVSSSACICITKITYMIGFCFHQFIIFNFSKLYFIVRISLICNLRFPPIFMNQ